MKVITTEEKKNLQKDEKLYLLIGTDSVYKAQETMNGKWSWFDMTTSTCLANGEADSLQELVEDIITLQTVFNQHNTAGADVMMEYDNYGEMVKDLASRLGE